MKNILIAPDSFKGTLSAKEVCEIIERAVHDYIPSANTVSAPLADGGEGICNCIYDAVGGRFITRRVTGVHGEKIDASYLMTDENTAVIESAVCCGLPLAGENNNPAAALTVGVGELIKDAVKEGAQKIIIGLGGTATNDCGIGMASALGYSFYDAEGKEIECCGAGLINLERIVEPNEKPGVAVICACDVTNTLCGESGAARVFAPQKGADEETVDFLERCDRNFARVVKKEFDIDLLDFAGGGAAGGMGAGAAVFCDATLKKGIEIVFDICRFEEKVRNADIIITGEGRLDSQSIHGKVISGVLNTAGKYGKKVVTICGCEGEGARELLNEGISEMYFCRTSPAPMEEIKRTCERDLYNAASEFAKKYTNN